MSRQLLRAGGLAALLILGGCSDDSDDTHLPGTWQAARLVLTDAGGRTDYPLPATWSETLVLHLDGTFAFASTQAGHTRTGEGFWSESADGLVFTGRRDTTRIYRLDGKTLVLSGTIPEGVYELHWRKTNADP